MLLSIGGLCWTFVSPGLDGVHRWIVLGPVSINAAFIFLPLALIAMDSLWAEGRQLAPLALAVILAAMLTLQPDASMVSALTMAVIPMVFLRAPSGKARAAGLAPLLLLALFSWTKPAALESVDYVEGILELARACGWFYWLAGIASLLILFCPFGIGAAQPARRPFCAGCAMFYLGTLLSAAMGAYPVPVIGYGVSPILGYLISASYAMRPFHASDAD